MVTTYYNGIIVPIPIVKCIVLYYRLIGSYRYSLIVTSYKFITVYVYDDYQWYIHR